MLKDLRSLKTDDGADDYAPVAARVSNHLMIESEDPDEGLALAIDALKKVHRELGIKNQAAKITGEKLNQKGVLALADKLTGKDLIIEYAGDMSDEMLQELDLLMARDETGMNVVMIDNREQLEAIHRQYPGLAKRFGASARPRSARSQCGKARGVCPGRQGCPCAQSSCGGAESDGCKSPCESGRPGENAVCKAKVSGTQGSRSPAAEKRRRVPRW
ncbi:hypothetical protein [Intestinimonas butyriciproducens]|uniref:hypothetical protein n=1 Tax=Intestinimonas butyriciproducens TaxID=1297617 RepID=UPI0039968441